MYFRQNNTNVPQGFDDEEEQVTISTGIFNEHQVAKYFKQPLRKDHQGTFTPVNGPFGRSTIDKK